MFTNQSKYEELTTMLRFLSKLWYQKADTKHLLKKHLKWIRKLKMSSWEKWSRNCKKRKKGKKSF